MEPRAEYRRRLADWTAAIARGDRTHLTISNLRLVVAAVAAVALWRAFVSATLPAAWVLPPAAAFFTLVVYHAVLLQRLERARRAKRVYERGLDRLEGRWAGTGRDGARYLDHHPYARDLDLFGSGSLFELLDTARTEAGEDTLADWLKGAAEPAEIRARQQAIDELRTKLDFREDVSVLAAEADVSRTGALAVWAAAAPAGITRAAAVVFASLAAVTVVSIVVVLARETGLAFLLVWLFAQSGVAAIWHARVAKVLGRIETPDRDLALLVAVLERIEREPFASARLAALERALVTGGVPPSRRIAQLRRLVAIVDSTENQMFMPIAALLLVKSQAAAAIDRWHAAYGHAIADWLRAVGDLEALSALATYAFEHPGDPFPEVAGEGAMFEATGLGHPLIPGASSVPNDVRLGGDGPHVLIVSGSNMSGKSTLLRAVGVNASLAQAGAPVRAARLAMSRLAIGATLRVEDSLQSGQSRFYAEILRIRGIVDATAGALPVLFLLDEILHGTNSYDRRIGAEAIVRSLVGRGAIGLVTTHDLALTELPAALGAAAANVHFEDRLEDGAMAFDYRMRPGVVEHSNALALMRAVGLDV